MTRLLLAIFNIVIVAAVALVALPIAIFALLGAAYRRLELSARYRGDTEKRDRDEYKDS